MHSERSPDSESLKMLSNKLMFSLEDTPQKKEAIINLRYLLKVSEALIA